MSISLSKIAEVVNGQCIGDSDIVVDGIAGLDNAKASELSFLCSPNYYQYLPTTRAAAVLLTKEHADSCPVASIVVSNPYAAYAKISAFFDPRPLDKPGIHKSSFVDESVKIGNNVSIGPNSTIYPGVVLEDNVAIGANCVIRNDVKIGEGTRLQDSISIYHSCVLGKNIIVHSGVVIGSDGFGIAKDNGKWYKISQIGKVVIGDDVEIGANTTIDRGAIEDTIIEEGVKLDNQIQIGHNVRIGSNTAVAGCVGVAGSSIIGKDCLIGGGVGIAGHNSIADNVTITAFSGVRGDITSPGIYSSAIGSVDFNKWKKIEARIRRLDTYIKSLIKLEKTVNKLEE